MKNNTSLKTSDSKCGSPKTPGGISKSLLTPCRRVGLSRNWRKSGPSPFISPLAGEQSSKIESVEKKKPTRKKICVEKDDVENTEDEILLDSPKISSNIVSTPSGSDQRSRKNKSKTLISSLTCFAEKQEDIPVVPKENKNDIEHIKENIAVSKPVKSKSLRKDKQSPPKSNIHDTAVNLNKNISNLTELNNITKAVHDIDDDSKLQKNRNSKTEQSVSLLTESAPVNNLESYSCSIKQKSPKDLTKKCIVVIQRKINKNAILSKETSENRSLAQTIPKDVKKNINTVSQALFDSDSDEAPLSLMSKKIIDKINGAESKKRSIQALDEVNEIREKVQLSSKIKKLEDKSICDMKSKTIKNSTTLSKVDRQNVIPEIRSSQSCDGFDDDDDFDFNKKRTILIRKTYDKVIQPQKAKSAGSVTQKNIDDLKARIEMKKNMLLAKAMTKETTELRLLIKKWKKGCQDALVELMDLMKAKFPDKQYMDYSEILQMLKIPSSLVGYDSDNDSFISPSDADIILEKFS